MVVKCAAEVFELNESGQGAGISRFNFTSVFTQFCGDRLKFESAVNISLLSDGWRGWRGVIFRCKSVFVKRPSVF